MRTFLLKPPSNAIGQGFFHVFLVRNVSFWSSRLTLLNFELVPVIIQWIFVVVREIPFGFTFVRAFDMFW